MVNSTPTTELALKNPSMLADVLVYGGFLARFWKCASASLFLLFAWVWMASCQQNKNLRTARPSEEVITPGEYLVDAIEVDINVGEAKDVTLGNTKISIPKDSAGAPYTIRMSRHKVIPADEYAAVLDGSDIVQIEFFYQNADQTILSSSELLKSYRFSQNISTDLSSDSIGMMVLNDFGTGSQTASLLPSSELSFENGGSGLTTSVLQVSINEFKLTNAVLWAVNAADSANSPLIRRGDQLSSQGGTSARNSTDQSAPQLGNLGTHQFLVGEAISTLRFANTGADASDCSVSPGLPAGLMLSVSSGSCQISGTPTAQQVSTVHTITATAAGGTNDTATVEIAVSALLALSTSSVAQHNCAILDNGALKCWGSNAFAQLGQGHTNSIMGPTDMGDNLAPIQLGNGRNAVQVSAGTGHTCALLDNSLVKCWGHNANGQLGHGTTETAVGDSLSEMGDALPITNLGLGRSVVQVVAGGQHSCALLDNGSVKCWGANNSGALGQGHTNQLGDSSGEMADALPAVSLGTGRTATQITAGYDHTCALLDNQSVKCWGDNSEGQLGLGNQDAMGDQDNEMGDSLVVVDLGEGQNAVQVSAGFTHTCALLQGGNVKCWGKNASGELGYGDTVLRGDGPGEMGNNLPNINLGTNRKAVQISAGHSATCALLDDGTSKCWGLNFQGALGQGHTAAIGNQANSMGDQLPAIDLGTGLSVRQISAIGSSKCAVLNNNQVKCWGYGGQHGNGNQHVGDDANEMGNNLPIVNLGSGRTAKRIGLVPFRH
jgi:alpha-tubulin suppressor-like RCC1 family protein